ncbi:hypothetical protein [Halomonas rhizosphaerae]|uniref:Uncharacterized protein n=1 Tax=Halomonas rhizosphaerae TaxID=3043296 RepID=A0ABT6V4D5_9GAMM|nr:hypothetical protein [Halomonas rhizosphaerae]MDI5891802.1 hypothetical protein [Halomonas rhizosphaerae]
MSKYRSFGVGAIVLFLASLAGLAIAFYAYITPLTGVTGTVGALIAIVACIALAVLALILSAVKRRGARIALRVLILLGLSGTFLAGLLLHLWWLSGAMVIGLVGLIIDMVRSTHHTRPVHS